jgi:hypothetical protein
MNERIRELAHEAGLPTYNPEGIPTKLEKFAQLIVERLCYDMMDVCGATQAERIQFVAKDWGVEL